MVNKDITRKMLNTETEAMNFFTNELKQFVENKELHYIQIYNADKTGLFWHSLTRKTQASKEMSSNPGHKFMKMTECFYSNVLECR